MGAGKDVGIFYPDTEYRNRIRGRWLLRVASAVVLTLILTGCGMQPTPSPVFPSPPPTRLPPTPSVLPLATPQPTPLPSFTPTPLPAPTPTPFPLPVRGATTCGGIEIRDGVIVNPATIADAEECFWQAFQICAVNEQLDVIHTGATILQYLGATYTVKNTGGRCGIQVSYSAIRVIRDPTTGAEVIPTVDHGAYTGDYCQGIARDTLGDLLFLGCGLGQKWNLMAP